MVEEVIKHYKTAAALLPGNPHPSSNLGIFLSTQGRHQEALDVLEPLFKSMVHGSPGMVETAYNLALVRSNSGKVESGNELLKWVTHEAPELCQASLMLGRSHMQVMCIQSCLNSNPNPNPNSNPNPNPELNLVDWGECYR